MNAEIRKLLKSFANGKLSLNEATAKLIEISGRMPDISLFKQRRKSLGFTLKYVAKNTGMSYATVKRVEDLHEHGASYPLVKKIHEFYLPFEVKRAETLNEQNKYQLLTKKSKLVHYPISGKTATKLIIYLDMWQPDKFRNIPNGEITIQHLEGMSLSEFAKRRYTGKQTVKDVELICAYAGVKIKP